MKCQGNKTAFVKIIQSYWKGHHFNIDSFQIIKRFFRKTLDKLWNSIIIMAGFFYKIFDKSHAKFEKNGNGKRKNNKKRLSTAHQFAKKEFA